MTKKEIYNFIKNCKHLQGVIINWKEKGIIYTLGNIFYIFQNIYNWSYPAGVSPVDFWFRYSRVINDTIDIEKSFNTIEKTSSPTLKVREFKAKIKLLNEKYRINGEKIVSFVIAYDYIYLFSKIQKYWLPLSDLDNNIKEALWIK